MTLCRLYPIKGVDILIESFEELNKEFSDICLLIVGDGPSREELIEQVNAANLKEKVIFTGWVPHEETPGYHAACDCRLASQGLDLGFLPRPS